MRQQQKKRTIRETMALSLRSPTHHQKKSVVWWNHVVRCCVGARRCAATSLPRIILFAIFLHVFFTALLVARLGDMNDLRNRPYIPYREKDPERVEIPRIKARGHRRAYNNNQQESVPSSSSALRKTATLSHEQGDPSLSTFNDPLLTEVDDLYVEHLQNISQHIQHKLNGATKVMSCRWRNNPNDLYAKQDCHYHMTQQQQRFQGHRGRVVLFNPLEQERVLCDGSRIAPASIRVIGRHDLNCSDPPRLYPIVPTMEAMADMEPMEVRFRPVGRAQMKQFPCDVPCISDDNPGVVMTRFVRTTPFAVEFSMEGPQYYQQLRINPKAHRYHKYYSTTSLKSEVPLPYFSWKEYGNSIQGTSVQYDQAIKGAVFLARNCNSRNNREALVKALIESEFRVDSVSSCLKNSDPPDGLTEKVDIMGRYLFALAFENQCEDDYVSEKLWGTLQSGSVPIYYGAPNVGEHVPPHSVINANAFNSSDALAEYLHEVANNKTLYESYHAWRTQPLPEAFVRKFNFTHSHSTCRTCRWAFAKKYGLGWNHQAQMVEQLYIQRKTCHDDQGMLTHPFHETWLRGGDKRVLLKSNNGKQSTCHFGLTSFTTNILMDTLNLRRTVRSQDGVTDILLESIHNNPQSRQDALSSDSSIILRMSTRISTDLGSKGALTTLSERHYRFQDDTSRITILTSRDTNISIQGEGILDVQIPHVDDIIEIRTIVENIDTSYNDTSNRTNYFGQVMTEDFLNPLEKFVVWGSPPNLSEWVGHELTDVGIISAADDDDATPDDDEAKNERDFHEESIKLEVQALKAQLALTKNSERKQEDNKKVLSGIKNLIASGVIKVHDVGEDETPESEFNKHLSRLKADSRLHDHDGTRSKKEKRLPRESLTPKQEMMAQVRQRFKDRQQEAPLQFALPRMREAYEAHLQQQRQLELEQQQQLEQQHDLL
ncbi:Glycoprotein 3-alpha-L-fucosyltransferase A [Seminavis robusta]|uniref:Fucosyltransferase n=1 Tax=Seminavis robusta TaxID=568900 RepID=A0A9N8EBA9_9STRA|nr:Glycoprotein 3-alpha-L-fucosyltransferase A [Seminavis robusta]|eukprot:Sro835_g208780.1 Glycoprotein 3-alpha-L-fucosyltransferase A (941) ;mRNA; f:4823-7946